jgi:chemotaxis protein histidine kinase CheA
MNQLAQLLKEKWFLVAADALVVIGILSLGLDPDDQFQAFLAVAGILAASTIVVLPVLREEGGRKQRLVEERRLRAALAQELDLLRAELRSAGEVASRRATDIEIGARKAGEAAAEVVARKASSEIAALRTEIAAASSAEDGLEELRSQIQSVADAARGATADAETAIEQAEAAAKQASALGESLGAARSKADAALKSHQTELAELRQALASLQGRIEALRANPLEASAPATRVDIPDVEPEAVERVEEEEETEETEEAEAEEEARESEDAKETEEAEEAEDAPLARTVMATEEDVGGTCLIVNLMIGIGNKPFVRGSGPGLSEEVGEPMQFLAIGRWLWRAPVGGTAVTVQVWKNDKSPLGEAVYIRAGESRELDEAFFAG